MRKVWVVVANSSIAKIYRAENTHTLVEKIVMEHPESHAHNRDLVSDKPGESSFSTTYGPHPMMEKTLPKTKEQIAFAKQIVNFLQESHAKGEFERLYLIAIPVFLGELRMHIPESLNKVIASEIHKDLTQIAPAKIREYLPPVL